MSARLCNSLFVPRTSTISAPGATHERLGMERIRFAIDCHKHDTRESVKTVTTYHFCSGSRPEFVAEGNYPGKGYFQLQLGIKLLPTWVNWCCSVPSESMVQI